MGPGDRKSFIDRPPVRPSGRFINAFDSRVCARDSGGRINRWYGELKFIENDLRQASPSGLDFTRFVTRLNSIDKAMMNFAAPKDLMTRSFTLHHHIEFVRLRLQGMRG